MSFSENATVFAHDADPAKIAEARRRGQHVVVLPKFSGRLAPESVLEEAQRLVHGDRGVDYGHPLDNHTTTAELFSAYLARKYGTLRVAQLGLDADDVCWFNILQKASRDAWSPKRDNLVDVAGYAENIQIVRVERARRADGLVEHLHAT